MNRRTVLKSLAVLAAAGTKWNFSIYVDDAYSAPGTRVFTSDFTLKRGNIYRVSATIPE